MNAKRSLIVWLCLGLLAGCNLPDSSGLPGGADAQTTLPPGLTPLPSLAPTSPPTATAPPMSRIDSGDQSLFYGDWERALSEYQTAFDHADQDELRFAAQLGIGRTYYRMGDYAAALDALRAVVDNSPDGNQRALAQFSLGQTFDQLQRYTEAADAYAQYLAGRPGLIDTYALERQADSLAAAGEHVTAINIYQQALAAAHLGEGLQINIKIGDSYKLLGDFNTALVVYGDVYGRSNNDYTKALMDLYIGQAHTALGQTEQAQTAWLHAVENYRLSYSAYLALVELVEADYPVSEFDRGRIDYVVGSNLALSGDLTGANSLFSLALAAFDRYLAAFPDQHEDELHFYRGLTLVELGNYEAGMAEFDELIFSHVGGRFWVDAWDEKSYTQWLYLDQYDQAIQTLLDFVTSAASNARAPEMLFIAGRIAERSGDLEAAAQIWSRTGIEYPNSDEAADGFFYAGIARFRLGKYLEAVEDFRSSLVVSNAPIEQARAHFWAGKTLLALDEGGEANLALQVAAASDPTGYYSERARDLLDGRAPFASGITELNYDLAAEREAAEAWVRNAFALGREVDLISPGPLASDGRFWRGSELWELGLYNEARLEFESLRQDVAFDPANTFRLANYFLELGLYRSSINAARQVLNLAGMDDAGTLSAPDYFNHIRFGIYYANLVLPVTETYNINPLFFISVMRQESLFEGFVISSAGARGLMQIIPSTGQSIATQIGWPPNYTSEDLYRPLVSVSLGADYLSAQRNYFDGDLYAALAAYNAGPGNAAVWLELAGGDQDLFLEIVRFRQTRNYIRGVYELFTIYRNLYLKTP